MDKQSTVVFRNVGQLYFPQTRVECHYSLTSDHQWSGTDWIGIFKVESPALVARNHRNHVKGSDWTCVCV